MVLWLPAGESGEFAIRGAKSGRETLVDGLAGNTSGLKFYPGSDNITVSYTQSQGMTIVDLDDGTKVVLLDRDAAYRFWAPTLSNDPMAPTNDTGKSPSLPVYDVHSAYNNVTVLVQGPYLVRTAVLNRTTKTLELTGDSETNETALYVFAPRQACSVSWNGKKLAVTATSGGLLKLSLEAPDSYRLPTLGPWKSDDSLPEVSVNYNTSSRGWVGKSERHIAPVQSA